MDSAAQPNTTLYINNLNDKINKEELRTQLYALFATYGKVIDVVATKSPKMRGQAFLVFADLAGATSAMRACAGMTFYDKPLRISYAKAKSYATLKREDPNFVPPKSAHAGALSEFNSKFASGVSLSEKRPRDDDGPAGRQAKREKQQESDEEMELDDDDDDEPAAPSKATTQQPSAQLLCTNLPQEVTDDVLSVLFQQYRGLQTVRVLVSPTPNAAGQPVKMAQILYETPQLAAVAKENLNGFALKKDWVMSVSYI
ncbi:hypothetical protein BJ322DRAFT_216517 [Thelephora terrestris]|uniref:RRM domain-containing protein n=1 Tax=Thelephora terrestris TaxID=56493 RepID=A0A9P6H9G9_9AGAM|nr:hypothetical protein BJ322DRAFT_216517 [Thelephora terrestris]